MFATRRHLITLLALLVMLIPVASVRSDVVTLEFTNLPDEADWDHTTWCTPSQAIQGNTLFQNLEIVGCKPGGDGDTSTYVRTIHEFNSSTDWFCEFKVLTTGSQDMISFAAPVVVTAFNSTGMLYHVTVSRDRVKFLRDVGLPIHFFDLDPAMPHTIRLELWGGPSPEYSWYIDDVLVDSGPAEGPFPVDDSRFGWRGKTVDGPTDNTWHYIRYGDIPIDASGDFDSDGEVNSFEVFYFDECLSESGAGVDAGPGCRWADMDGDTDVDCDDYDSFADAWTAPGDPPPIGPCAVGQIIPATSDWGVAVLALALLTAASLAFRRTATVP